MSKEKEGIKCYLGFKLKRGQRVIRVYNYSNNPQFLKATIINIDLTRKYGDCIQILTDGNSKGGWTYPRRLISELAFKQEIEKL